MVECKVLSIDSDERRISLGLKQLREDPLNIFIQEYPVNSDVIGKIYEMLPRGVIVSLGKGLKGFIPFSHLIKKKMRKPDDRYSLGEKLKLKIIEIDEKRRNIVLSEKEYVLEQHKKLEEAKDQEEENIEEKTLENED
ncbi:hypothetical protein ES703_40855 [subsurface metagenome]